MKYEEVKGFLVCRLLNREQHKDQLSMMPHAVFLDLAIAVYLQVQDENGMIRSRPVTYELLKEWDVAISTLLTDARLNTPRYVPQEFCNLRDMLKSMLQDVLPEMLPEELRGEEQGEELAAQMAQMHPDAMPMYVLTNRDKHFGAVMMAYDSTLQAVGDILQDDFWILPSSVHECIIIPACVDTTRDELSHMVQEVNRTEVPEEEILSDMVYFYQRKQHSLKIA